MDPNYELSPQDLSLPDVVKAAEYPRKLEVLAEPGLRQLSKKFNILIPKNGVGIDLIAQK